MTLDEAIQHCKEVAKKNEERAEVVKEYDAYTELECMECAEEHLQLADWLEELKNARILLEATYELLGECGYMEK